MSVRRTGQVTYGRPKFLALPSMSPRRISVPGRTERFTPAERAFLRVAPVYARALEKYNAFYPVYARAAIAVYNKYNVPENIRFSGISHNRNAELEHHVLVKPMYNRNTPEKRRFIWVTKHLLKLVSDVRASEQVYKNTSNALRQEYGMPPHGFWSSKRNFSLENRIKNKSARVIQSQARRNLTIKGLSTFGRGMNARKFPQNLTQSIMRLSVQR